MGCTSFVYLLTCLQVESVNIFQQRVNQFWEAYQEDLQKQVPGVTLDDFKWARALVSTIFEKPASTHVQSMLHKGDISAAKINMHPTHVPPEQRLFSTLRLHLNCCQLASFLAAHCIFNGLHGCFLSAVQLATRFFGGDAEFGNIL
jgi:hypothetical protein